MNKIYLHCRQWMGNALGVLNMRILIMLISLALCFSANAGGHLVKGVGKTSIGKSVCETIIQTEKKAQTEIIGNHSNFKQMQKKFHDPSCHGNNSNNKRLFTLYSAVNKEDIIMKNFFTSQISNVKGEFKQPYADKVINDIQKKTGINAHYKVNSFVFDRRTANKYKKEYDKNFLNKKWPDKPNFFDKG
jgi:hypothetical protein